MPRGGGFTLLELVVVVTIMGILLAAGAPAMQDLLLDARRTRILNEILRALHVARVQSLRSGREVVFCPRSAGEDCDDDGWERGWFVFINDDSDQPAHLDDGERVVLRYKVDDQAIITANRKQFVYRPHARRATAGSLLYCDRRGSASARAVIVSHTGRPRVASRTASGRPLSCPV